jgi:GNAT superfamily N-acetyltransferase
MQCDKLTYSEVDKICYLQPEGWTDITEAFRFYCKCDFCKPIKITLDSEIVGIGNSVLFDKSAWLAHIIVKPDYRKRGIGHKIVDALLDDIKARGIETSLLIATELGEPVYLKSGFRKVSDYCFFKRDSIIMDKQFTSKIQPYKDDFYNDIIQLDTYVSGENRENLIPHYLIDSFVHINNKVIDGFYLPNLGEGPIFALSTEAGKELMRFKYSTIDKAVIPGENQVGIEFLKELGFVDTNTTGKRMILGNDIEWKPEMIYSRIGGNFG